METKDKKEVANYIIETHDFNSGVPMDDGWDEIDCKGTLDKALDEYEKQLAKHDTLRIVKETRTVITQSCKAQKFIGELEQNINEVSKRVHDYLVTVLKNTTNQDYFCNIQLTDDDILTEMTLDIDHEAIEVIIYGRNDCYSRDLGQLHIDDQLTILKAVAEKQ